MMAAVFHTGKNASLKIGGKDVGKLEAVTVRKPEPDVWWDIPIPGPQTAEFTLCGPREPQSEKMTAWLIAADRLDELGHDDAARALRVLAEAIVERSSIHVRHGPDAQWPETRAELWWPAGPAAVEAAEVLR